MKNLNVEEATIYSVFFQDKTTLYVVAPTISRAAIIAHLIHDDELITITKVKSAYYSPNV